MSKSARHACVRRYGLALALLSLVANCAGCVQRRMTIRSNPPGALVYVDDYQIGTTPASTDFIYYGTRKIRLVKDGYETLTVYQPMPTPWYQWFGIDFFSENIWPGEIRDERAYDYQMIPTVAVPAEQLRDRAEQLRNASRVLPAAAVEPVIAPPIGSAPAIAEPLPQGAFPAQPILPPPGPTPAYGAPGGYGGGATFAPPPVAPPPVAPPPQTPPYGAPAYGVPGLAPPLSPPNTPGGFTEGAPQFNQPVVPPGWRPMGQAPTDGQLQRR